MVALAGFQQELANCGQQQRCSEEIRLTDDDMPVASSAWSSGVYGRGTGTTLELHRLEPDRLAQAVHLGRGPPRRPHSADSTGVEVVGPSWDAGDLDLTVFDLGSVWSSPPPAAAGDAA